MIYLTKFQKDWLIRSGDETERQHDDLISLLLFFQSKKSWHKTNFTIWEGKPLNHIIGGGGGHRAVNDFNCLHLCLF
jgi:hypothetical protein